MNLVRHGCKSSTRNLLRWVANNAACLHNPKRKRGAMLQSLAYRLVDLMDLLQAKETSQLEV
jgi:hypothetical protein